MFFIIALIATLTIYITRKCGHTKLHIKNTLIAVLSSISLANWIFLLYLTCKDNRAQSSVALIYVIASSYILNIIFFCLYLNIIRQDEYYN